MDLKDTVFNVSAIHKRMGDVSKNNLHYFSHGNYGMLTLDEVKLLRDIIDNDYKAISRLLNSLTNLKKK